VLLAVAVLTLQSALAPRADLHAGLDTLYGGDFARAAAYFAALAARHPSDPAPLVFEAGAYIWWASARDSAAFELARIDSLLGLALARARAAPGPAADFWQATALGYRARQREETGHAFSAAKDAKVMRDIYRRILAADSSCADCYLGLGVYEYGLARASALARFFARLIGLGSGNAERGIRYLRRAAHEGDLARVESIWVLAAALMREAARDARGRAVLEREARGYVETLATRYPNNPVFQRFLRETAPAGVSATESIRAPTGAAATAIAGAAIRRGERGQLAQHVVHVTLHGVGRDVQPLRDLLVAESRRDELFDLLLALGEPDGADSAAATRGADVGVPRAAVVRRAGGARRCGRRWEIGAARDGANGFHDVVGSRVFHDEPVGAALDELMDVLLRRHEIHDDRFRVRRLRFQIAEEVVAVAVRERRVEQHDVRLRGPELLRGSLRGVHARDDLDVGIDREQSREAVAHETVVLDDEDADSTGGRRGCGDPSVASATSIHRPFALGAAIIQTATALGRHTALYAANGPRHTPPPFLGVMYFSPGSNGSDHRNEGGWYYSLL
jgi:hypothetical protein